jgi:hypothetical protein
MAPTNVTIRWRTFARHRAFEDPAPDDDHLKMTGRGGRNRPVGPVRERQ